MGMYLPPKEVGQLFINGLYHPIYRFSRSVRARTTDTPISGSGQAGTYATYYFMLWDAGDYARCRALAIPYGYWGMEEEERTKTERGEGKSTPAGFGEWSSHNIIAATYQSLSL
jgi:hypothetical protein